MKTPAITHVETPQFSVSPTANPKAGAKTAAAAPAPKPAKAGKASSQSRDTREDRGERQMKTTHNPQSVQHGK